MQKVIQEILKKALKPIENIEVGVSPPCAVTNSRDKIIDIVFPVYLVNKKTQKALTKARLYYSLKKHPKKKRGK